MPGLTGTEEQRLWCIEEAQISACHLSCVPYSFLTHGLLFHLFQPMVGAFFRLKS